MDFQKDEFSFFTKIVKLPILTLIMMPYVLLILLFLTLPSELPRFIGIVYFIVVIPIMVFVYALWQKEQHDKKILAKTFNRQFPLAHKWIKDKMQKHGIRGEPALSQKIDSPYIFYGRLYLPEDLLKRYENSHDSTIEAVILHELGHIVGGDGYALETITGLNFIVLFSSLFFILVEAFGFALPIVLLTFTFFASRIILLGLAEYQADIFVACEQETVEHIQKALIQYEVRKIKPGSTSGNRMLQFDRPPRKKLKSWQQPFYVFFGFPRPSIKNRLEVLQNPKINFDYQNLLLGLGILCGVVFITVTEKAYLYFVIVSMLIFYINVHRIRLKEFNVFRDAKNRLIPPFTYLIIGYFFSSLLSLLSHYGKIQTEISIIAPFSGDTSSLFSTYAIYTVIFIVGCFGIAIFHRNKQENPG